MSGDKTSSKGTLGSVVVAARVLKSFTATNREWGVSDLARKLGIPKSTTHRSLATLADEGLLQRDPENGRYRLGLAIFDLAAAVQSFDLHEAALSPMNDLRTGTGETVQIAVLDGREVVYVERLDSPNTLRMFLEVGRRNSAHCTGCGKVLLAFSPPDRLETILKGWKLPKGTKHTITTLTALRTNLAQIRRQGYATNKHESEIGVVSVAAPIRDGAGRLVAALSVAGPAERLDPHELQLSQVTMQTAATISRRLGYQSQDR